MNPIEELKAEHEGIKASLEILRSISRKMDEPEGVIDWNDLEDLLEFYTVFVDTCHHGKEEELLFPALEALGVSREGGPVGVMLVEHEEGRGHVRELKKALAAHRQQEPAAAEAIRKHSGEYIRLLHRHIEKENQILFRIAEEHLSSEEKDKLEQGFERIERERVGEGRHEAFHRKLEDLQKKYIG